MFEFVTVSFLVLAAIYIWLLRVKVEEQRRTLVEYSNTLGRQERLLQRYGRDPDVDPGPLSDDDLRWTLRSSHFPASKTLDRVQDAFDRLIREARTVK